MLRFRKYLAEATHLARKGDAKNLHIVLGNTSCDMDSCVGALALGFYYTVKSDFKEVFVPVINCNKADFKINLEIVQHVNDNKIDVNDLYFIDELVAQYKPEEVKEVVLVDHNILDVTQSQFSSSVTRVIDHHIDNNAYAEQLNEKICRFVGSACSLVAFKFQED